MTKKASLPFLILICIPMISVPGQPSQQSESSQTQQYQPPMPYIPYPGIPVGIQHMQPLPSVTIFNDGKAASTTINDLTSQQAAIQQASQVTHAFDWGIVKGVTSLHEKICNSGYSILQTIKNNKLKCAVAVSITLYLYLSYKIYQAHLVIKNNHSWCNWKQTVELQYLLSANPQQLSIELHQAINKHYLQQSTLPKDLSAQFFKDLISEQRILQYYLDTLATTKRWYCSMLFYFKLDPIMIQEKLARLHLLLDIFSIQQPKTIEHS